MPIIREKVKSDNIIYIGTFRSYNALGISGFKDYRIDYSQIFADKHNHINSIKNFWSQAKRHMMKFNGIPKPKFNLFLKECEFWFNYGFPREQVKTLKKWIKIYNQK